MVEITCRDLVVEGEDQTMRLPAGTYVVTTTEPAYVASEQHFSNGTVQITIKDVKP